MFFGVVYSKQPGGVGDEWGVISLSRNQGLK